MMQQNNILTGRLSSYAAFAAILFLILLGFCSAAEEVPNYSFVREATSAHSVSHYDYIIIGGGTAGCPLAATLSQNATVLLLERGGSPYNSPYTNLSVFGVALLDPSSSSPAQQFVSEDGVSNARARVLGGGTVINAGFYSRAAGKYVNEAGWEGKLVNESYKWVEDVLVFQPQMRQWQSAVRGGLLEAGVNPDNGFTYEHLTGTKIGGTIFDRDGQRHTAANLLKYADPKELTVLLHASVDRILFKTREGKKGKKRVYAHGVVFRDASGVEHKAYIKNGLKNEIIVSAGALGSPQLLMLSGIGPKSSLKAQNIPLVLDQPLVGQDMADNPLNAVFVPSPKQTFLLNMHSSGRGFVSSIGGNNQLWKLHRSISGFNFAGTSTNVPGGIIFEKLSRPVSRGHLELRTNNTDDNPSVTFNYFQDPKDVKVCVKALKVIERVIESKAFGEFRFDNVSFSQLLNTTPTALALLLPRPINASNTVAEYCRNTVMTIWHYHGGCQVGRVVDSDYKVIGVDALRVIDGSTFEESPGTNPQATLMMLGRYMGVKILKERGLKTWRQYEQLVPF